MIVEKIQDIFALFSAQGNLFLSIWSRANFLTVAPSLFAGLLLLLLVDYGRMLHLHYKMVHTHYNIYDESHIIRIYGRV